MAFWTCRRTKSLPPASVYVLKEYGKLQQQDLRTERKKQEIEEKSKMSLRKKNYLERNIDDRFC